MLREKAPEASLEKKIKQIDDILANREQQIFTQVQGGACLAFCDLTLEFLKARSELVSADLRPAAYNALA